MKKNQNRLISLLLALAMVLSMASSAVLAAEAESSFSAPVREAVSSQAESSAPQEEPAEAEEEASRGAEEEAPVSDESRIPEDSESPEGDASAPEQSGEAEAASPEEGEEEPQEAEETEEAPEAGMEAQETAVDPQGVTYNVIETIPLSLNYDDRYSFSDTKDGYVVAKIQDENPTSYQVDMDGSTNKNAKAKVLDKHVLTLESGSDTDAVAAGTGTATVLLVKKGDRDAQGAVDAVQVDVEVSPAPLTILFLGGQSNMEGWGSKGSGESESEQYQHPEDSIICPEGEVYSTYAPGKSARKRRANSIGGHVNFGGRYCTKSAASAKEYLPQCLTGKASAGSYGSGTKLVYPLNQLTAQGKGKSGMDSALAYEWNRLTGEKVWTVNAAVGSSRIRDWLPGKECFERAYHLYGYALFLYYAEVDAGHYTPAHQLFFWLQGEHDKDTSGSKYFNDFKVMHNNLKEKLASLKPTKAANGPGFEQMGIISVRASKSKKNYRNSKDLIMTGPRVVQSYLANTRKLTDVHMVSDVNESWVSDSGVKKYFEQVYGSKLNYKTQDGKLSLPTKVSQVHNDIHYHQVAHNENGLTAARGMYEVLEGTAQPSSVRWRASNGKAVSKLNLAIGESTVISPAVSPVSASKTVKWRLSEGLSYSGTTGKVSVTGAGKQRMECVAEDGTVVSTLVVSNGNAIAAPSLSSVSNVKGKKLKAAWSKVSGAEKYEIQCSVKSDFSGAKKLTVSGTSATLSGLKTKKTYYIRVRSRTTDEAGNAIISKWSGKKSVKVTK